MPLNQNIYATFESVPVIGVGVLSAANTARDGSGSITSIVTGSAAGTQVDFVQFISAQTSAATNSAMVGRVFISLDGGTTWYLFDEVAIPAAAASNTVVGAKQSLSYVNLRLVGTSCKLGVTKSVHAGVQDQLHIIARGGDLTAAAPYAPA